MEQYKDYQYEDFVSDDRFIDWVLIPTPEEDEFWGEVGRRYPYQKEAIEKARLAVLSLNRPSVRVASDQEVAEVWSGITKSIESRRHSLWRSVWGWVAVGAAACVLVWIGDGLRESRESSPDRFTKVSDKSRAAENVMVVNQETAELSHYLPDSSLVLLKKGSSLEYNSDLAGSQREVKLKGQAYFKVKRDTERPFMVLCQGLVVKVLGTSFTVKDNEDGMSVEVETGRVSVYRRNSNGSTTGQEQVLLGANEKVDFNLKTSGLAKSLVDEPMPIVSEEVLETFSFENQPVSQIFGALERVYGVKINYPKETMERCRLTTSLANETLFEKLDVLCAALQATYRIEDTQIWLEGGRCF